MNWPLLGALSAVATLLYVGLRQMQRMVWRSRELQPDSA